MSKFRKSKPVDPSKDKDANARQAAQSTKSAADSIKRCTAPEYHECDGVVHFYCSETGVSGAFVKKGNEALVKSLQPEADETKKATTSNQTPKNTA